MNDGLIPNRYAKALFKFAAESGKQDQVYGEMKQLALSYSQSKQLKAAVTNPFLPADDKEKLLLTAAGAKQGGVTDRFLHMVIGRNRAEFLHSMALAYEKLYRRDRGIARVEIVSATKLPDAQTTGIVSLIKKQLDASSIELSKRVDPALIGGFTVNVDDQVLDASVKSELEKLRLKLLS